LTRFVFNGTDEQLCVTGTVSQNYTGKFSTCFTPDFGGVQRGLLVENKSASSNVSSISAAIDVLQCYDGQNTVFPDIENTVHLTGERIRMKVNPKAPLAKISARGIDITSRSAANCGSNVGLYAEAGGPANASHAAGVMGFTNPNSGSFSTGVLGCANLTRNDVAQEVNNAALMSLTVGGYFCNPLTGPNDYALCANGRVKFTGTTTIEGDLCVDGLLKGDFEVTIGNSLCVEEIVLDVIRPKTDENIEVLGSLNPGITTITLGNTVTPWCEGHFKNLFVTENVFGTDVVRGNLIQGNLFEGGDACFDDVKAETLTANSACFTDLKTETANIDVARIPLLFVEDLCGFSPIQVSDDLVPNKSNVFLGSSSNKWRHGFFSNLTVCDDLIANVIVSNIECSSEIQTDTIGGKTDITVLTVTSSLIPEPSSTFSLGSLTEKWSEAWFDEVTICQSLSVVGNASISGKLTVNEICVEDQMTFNKLTTDLLCVTDTADLGNLVVSGDTSLMNTDVTGEFDVTGNASVSGKLTVTRAS
jgi:hypothetical protein